MDWHTIKERSKETVLELNKLDAKNSGKETVINYRRVPEIESVYPD